MKMSCASVPHLDTLLKSRKKQLYYFSVLTDASSKWSVPRRISTYGLEISVRLLLFVRQSDFLTVTVNIQVNTFVLLCF
jgi:hypothetical protein